MTFSDLAKNYPGEFREALKDLRLEEIAYLLDRDDLAEIGLRVWKAVEAVKDDVEQTPVSDSEEVNDSRKADIAVYRRATGR